MGCCLGGGTSVEEDDKAPRENMEMNGLVPSSQRKCRDVLCGLLFIVYWIGMAVVAILAVKTGKPLGLIYGKDYNGDVCGIGNFTDRKLTTYPRLDQDLLAATAAGIQVANMQFFGVCMASCPLAGAKVCTYDNASCWVSAQDTTATLFRCIPSDSQANETILNEVCIDPEGAEPNCTNALYLKKQCSTVCHTKRVQKVVWEIDATTPNPLVEQLQGKLQVLGRFLNDMHAAKWIILLGGGLGAMALGVVWLVVLQFFAGCMVWLTCLLVLLVLVLMSLFCSFRSGVISADFLSGLSFLVDTASKVTTAGASQVDVISVNVTSDISTQTQFKVAAYLMWTLSGIALLLVFAMRKRIHIAIAIIRESSRAIKTLPLLLFWPVVPTLCFVALVVYSVVIAAYLLSSDDLASVVQSSTAQLTNLTASYNLTALSSFNMTTTGASAKTTQQVLLAYHVFGFLWTNQLLQAISICAIAGSVAQYYWTAPENGGGGRKLEARFPIARAVHNTLRFSLGSLCFGSFMIAFSQFLRLVLEYVNRNTKQLQQSNRVVKVAFLVVRCCLWCFEKCLKFLSRNAYIVIAMQGKCFCAASVEAFKILLRNIARVAVVNSISFFMLFLVKTTITLTVGVVVFAVLSSSASATIPKELAILSGPVTSPMAPVLVACVLAWLVASAFANVYEAAIDTILLCFCEDTAMNGEAASEFMSDELRCIMGGGIHSGAKHTVIRVASAANGAEFNKEAPRGQSATPSSKVHVDTEI